MSARSCLLCGKSLSRMRVGAGDEFCSREHRNQYRLRRGMDRLLEANKVADVMRRRENPRQMPAARLMNGGPQTQRAFPNPPVRPAALLATAGIPKSAPAIRPHVSAAGPLPPLPVEGAAAFLQEPSPAPFRTGRACPPPAPPVLSRMEPQALRPQPAPPVSLVELPAAAPQARRKLSPASWRTAGAPPPVIEGVARRLAKARVNPIEGATARACSSFRAAARKGRVLRVSLAAGFHIPEWKLRPITFPAPRPAVMRWPGLRTPPPPIAAGADVPERMAPQIRLEEPAMRIPAAPAADFNGSFHWPGVMEVPRILVNPAVLHRVESVPFGSGEDGAGKERTHEYRN